MTAARLISVTIIPTLLVAAAVGYLSCGSATPPGQPRLVSLDSDRVMPVRECFNQAPEELRLVLLLSPT